MRHHYFGVLIGALSVSLIYEYRFRGPSSLVEHPKLRHYDYIVVGGGTAGCVLASRLSEEAPNVTVLLVEAGGHIDRWWRWWRWMPLAAPLMQLTEVDWAYKTERQRFSSRGFRGQRQSWPRGKGLGGSGQLNYLMHSYGVPEDYAGWPKGWSFGNIRPYLDRVSRSMSAGGSSAPPEHGGRALARAFFAAADELARDNGRRDDGKLSVSAASSTSRGGRRWTSYDGYLRKAWNRRNLDILPNTLVTKILFDGRETKGIAVTQTSGHSERIAAQKEVILSAGAVNTPQLLMLSGLGPIDELRKHRIPLVKGLPDVGRNLIDHMNLPIYVNVDAPVSPTLGDVQSISELWKYAVHGSGWLAGNGVLGTAVYNRSGLLLFGMATVDEKVLKNIGNFETETFRRLFPSHNDTSHRGFLYLASCLQPRSRGKISLRSRDVWQPPRIEPSYLEIHEDVVCTQRAISLAMRMLETKAFAAFGARAHTPDLRECRRYRRDYRDPSYSECLMRVAAMTGYHPIGSCRMGGDDRAVVDENLRVRGVSRLRIMDGSVLPSPISGPPNSLIVAMAERAVDLILADDG